MYCNLCISPFCYYSEYGDWDKEIPKFPKDNYIEIVELKGNNVSKNKDEVLDLGVKNFV